MKNKKGFAIIETLITTVVLTTALITFYVLYNNMMVKEKRRINYDDPMYIVRSNYLFDIFFNILKQKSVHPDYPNYPATMVNFDDYLTVQNDDETLLKLYLTSFSCENSVFEDKSACQEFFKKMHIYRIYLSRFDLSYIQTCKNSNDRRCIDYKLLNSQTKLYFKSLPYVPGAEGYYIIFEFNEDGNGETCNNNDCMRKYAAVKYGGSNTIINLK